MKMIVAIACLSAATAVWAFDVPVRQPDGRIVEGWPKRVGAVVNPTPETCEAAGYSLATPAQVDAQELADAEDRGKADAANAALAAAAAEKEKAIAAAASKSKKDEAAKLEAANAAKEKEPSEKEKNALLWKWKMDELEAGK